MTDDQLVAAFEDTTLPNESFHHADHVRLAWIYLGRYPFAEAVLRFANGLRVFASAKGHAGLYHETITWAYLVLVNERCELSKATDWEEFALQNEDLLRGKLGLLRRYYREETLHSDLARRVFVFPDSGTPHVHGRASDSSLGA